ncbi:ANTAR domain-containing protein [Saccharothrix longispora]|uniref:Anti-anti-sigma factor n=1 Tax=Saccharothrix longispora TaxID=33920 RepID=A0ABU1PSE0_9PSEU|nr:ANTAR domain-containing protein [Saccharothrix longispora]MDR6593376.1 anti-anti-sigma factor [Saccharothrix longispora]
MATTVNRSTTRQAAADGTAVRVDVVALTPAGPVAGGAQVVAVSGELDAAASATVSARLAELVEAGHGDLVVDLTGVRLLSGAGVTALFGVADDLAGTGRRLRVVAGNPAVARVLRGKRLPDVVDVHPTVGGALGAQSDVVGGHPDATVLRLAREVRDLRAKLGGRPVIARALGMLQERYLLADADTAFTLLRRVSQRSNVRMRELAETLVDLPRPRPREPWPPPEPAPDPGFGADLGGGAADTRPDVLRDLLRAVLERTRAAAGEVRLVEGGDLNGVDHAVRARPGGAGPDSGGSGVGPAGIDSCPTAPAEWRDAGAVTADAARRRRTRIVVAEVADDPLFTGSTAIDDLRALGVHAVVSTPLLSAEGECLAVVTTFHGSREQLPTADEHDAVDELTDRAARWLEWSHRNRVSRALERLHAAAKSMTVPPAAF